MPQDLYKILQVDPSAEPEIIEAAYKRLVRKYHPDVNQAPDATMRMQELNDAYAVLGNPDARIEYDQARLALFLPPSRRASVSTTRWWIVSGLIVVGGLLILGACFLFSGAFVFLREQPEPTATRPARAVLLTHTPTATNTRTPEPTPTRTLTPRPTARPSVTPTLAPLGLVRERPVPLGQSIVWTGREGEQLRFAILSAYRGDEARMMIQAASPSNLVVTSDWALYLFKVRADYLNAGRKASMVLSEFDFRAMVSSGQEYPQPDSPAIVPPAPRLGRNINVGDVVEGWLAFAVRANEADVVIAYGQTIFPNEMRVWLSAR